MKAIIVEDEKNSRDNLIEFLRLYCEEVEVIGEAESVNEAILLLKRTTADILFLDIKIKGGSGFDVLHRSQNIPDWVIFTTAYDEYAIEAIKADAFDYLLKPIDIDELIDSVARVKRKITSKSSRSCNNMTNKLGLPTLDGVRYIDIPDIIHCQSQNYYTWFYLEHNEKIFVSKTLKYFEELLSHHGFLRVHQSHLVNIAKIVKYHTGKGGYVTLSNNQNIEVSIRKRPELLNTLNIK